MLDGYERGLLKLSDEERRLHEELTSCHLHQPDNRNDIDDIATIVYCGIRDSDYTLDDVKKVVRKIRELRTAVNEFFALPYMRRLEEFGYEVTVKRDTEDEF